MMATLDDVQRYAVRAIRGRRGICVRYPQIRSNLARLTLIEDPPLMVRIITHLGLSTRAPPRSVPSGLIIKP